MPVASAISSLIGYESIIRSGNFLKTASLLNTIVGPAWFVLKLLITLSAVDVTHLREEHDIIFSSDKMLQTGWYQLYLNNSQIRFLLEGGYAKIYPLQVKNSKSIRNENEKMFTKNYDKNFGNVKEIKTSKISKRCLVRTIPNWNTTLKISGTIANSYYVVENCHEDILNNDPQVLSFQMMSDIQVRNRYVSGMLQSGEKRVKYDGGYVKIPTPLNNRGLLGQNQVINIVDTGLDIYHPFFHDANHSVPINTTNFTHRKIVRYDAFSDAMDRKGGHGTHVVGTALGNPSCQNCGLKMYRGVAPEAKVHFVDFENTNDPNKSTFPDMDLAVKNMESTQAKISSNSWGIPGINIYNTAAFDKLAYDHPDILFIIAGGNSGSDRNKNPIFMSIESPADGKNVFTVGNIIQPQGYYIEDKQYRRYLFVNATDPDDMVLVTPNPKGKDIWTNSETEYNEWLNNKEVVDENATNMTGKIMVYSSDRMQNLCSSIVKAIKGNASAMILPRALACKNELEAAKLNYSSIFVFELKIISDQKRLADMKKISLSLQSSKDDVIMGLRYSSAKGPTIFGNTKPDVVAIGTDITSANAGDPSDHKLRGETFAESLLKKSGTSMSTPAIAGAAALIRQYFNESWYPTNEKDKGQKVDPSATLLKAILVNSAEKILSESPSSPSNEEGYGVPNLEYALGFSNSKFKFVDKVEMPSKEQITYRMTVSKTSGDLRVTMAYNDPPLAPERVMRYYADLNVYVISPKNKVYLGNDGPYSNTDPFATIEKVFIPESELEDGNYTIHIVSSDYPGDEKVYFSLVVNGPITSGLEKINEKKCPKMCGTHGKCVKGQCVCNEYYTGISCDVPVSIFPAIIRVRDMTNKKVRYYNHTVVSHVGPKTPLRVTFDNSTVYGDRVVCYSPKVLGRIADKSMTCLGHSFYITDELESGDPIYFAVFTSTPPSKKDEFRVVIERVFVNDDGVIYDDKDKDGIPKDPDSVNINSTGDVTGEHNNSDIVNSPNSDHQAEEGKKQEEPEESKWNKIIVIVGATVGSVASVGAAIGATFYFIRKKMHTPVECGSPTAQP